MWIEGSPSPTTQGVVMYIGIGTLVIILIVLLLIVLL